MTQSTEPAELLQTMPVEKLLTAAYALTHRMHAADEHARDYRGSDRDELNRRLAVSTDLRAQRDLIDAEIIRRTTEGA